MNRNQPLMGKVKWFNAKLGYGFIENPSDDQDIFIHHTEVIRYEPRPGDVITCCAIESAHGLRAIHARIILPSEAYQLGLYAESQTNPYPPNTPCYWAYEHALTVRNTHNHAQ